MDAHEIIQKKIEKIAKEVEDGHKGALDALMTLRWEKKQLQDSLNMIADFENENLELITREVEAYGGTYKGKDFSVRSGGKTWKYSHIPAWKTKKAELKAIEDEYKSYWDAKHKGAMIASEDGEEIILPEVGYRRASVVITKSKES